MAYLYLKVDDLQEEEKVGSSQCVVLVQHYANAPQTSIWQEGQTVMGNLSIKKGTAIATFKDGKYPNKPTGNHAAFYLDQDAGGIWIMDQWANNDKKPKISKRYIRSKGKNKDGTYIQPSDNADAFSIIE